MSHKNSHYNHYSFLQFEDPSCINERALYELFFPNLKFNTPCHINIKETEKILFTFNKPQAAEPAPESEPAQNDN